VPNSQIGYNKLRMKKVLQRTLYPVALLLLGARKVFAADCPSGTFCFSSFLKEDTVEGLIGSMVSWLTLAAGSVLVIAILVGAFMIMTSGGNTEQVTKGRKAITWALIGFAVILLAGGLGNIIAGFLGGTVDTTNVASSTIDTPEGVVVAIDQIAKWMFNVLMALGTVFVLYSAFLYMISAGDQEKINRAKNALIYAIAALVIGVLAGGADMLIKDALDVPENTSACSVGSWKNEACQGTYKDEDEETHCERPGERLQTRTTTPPNCKLNSKCFRDTTCQVLE